MTQNKMVIAYCRENGSITAKEAADDLGCMRLAARIADLEKEGYVFNRKKVESVNRYGGKVWFTRYSLKEKE